MSKICLVHKLLLMVVLGLFGVSTPAFADRVLDLRATFPERKPYTGPASQPVTKEFSFPSAGRFRITVTYAPWYRVTNEQFRWRSIAPIDGRDYGAWVEFIPGVTPDDSKTRAVPDPRVDGGGLVIVYEVTVRRAQPRMEAAIFPAVVRFGDGSLHQLPSSASVVIESLVGDGSGANSSKSAFDPGRVWTVEEPDFEGGTWYGTWTRRGDGNTYDAYWRHTSGREHRGTVEFRGINGQHVSFFRPDVNGTYSAVISADGRAISGGTASWYPAGWTWKGGKGGSAAAPSTQAPRPAFDPGRVWTVEEPDFQGGTWYGTWTRRGNGNTYDAYWRHTSGREHRGTVEFRGIDAQRIAFFRPDVNGTYSAQIGADGKTVTGGTASWYPAGWTWRGSRTEP